MHRLRRLRRGLPQRRDLQLAPASTAVIFSTRSSTGTYIKMEAATRITAPIIVFILIIAILVQLLENFLKKFIPALYQNHRANQADDGNQDDCH